MKAHATGRPKTIAKLTKIGNSRGIRIPKALIEQAGLTDEVELIARDGEILIANRRHSREGWAEAMELAYQRGELELTDEDYEWLEASSPIPPELLEDEDNWWEQENGGTFCWPIFTVPVVRFKSRDPA